MKQLDNLSIYTKFFVVLLSMLLALSLFFGFIMWDNTDKSLGEQLDKHGLELAANLASLGTNHILLGNSYSLFELINETHKHNQDVRYIYITDHQNRLLAHTFVTGFPKGLLDINRGKTDVPYSIVRMNTDEEVIRDITLPVENGMIGFVHVGMTEKAMREQLTALIKRMFFITLAVCIAAAVASASMAKSITQPLRQLSGYTDQLRQGALDINIAVGGSDEVGRLGLAFRQMAESLSKTSKERNLLIEELKEKEQLRKILLNKVITAQEDERKRISRELHDEAGQSLTSLIVSLRILADRAADPAEKEILLGARELAACTLKDIRTLAVDLRPPAIDDLGLVPALTKYANDFHKRYSIAVDFSVTVNDGRIHSQTATALYRIMQESLTNVVKHAGAKHIAINLEVNTKHIVLSVTDDGQGFKQSTIDQARQENRLGLYGMMERAELLGGTVEYASVPGQGTTIRVIVPNPEEAYHGS
ncbi:HAMP domain-containing sensor histidine kinase [Sporomusa sp.]|uniref:HAMP domain-containing sensor histidine kinase n=1 Tax=Sporomusa sp. TaxID=2078658 RepID=UPI002BB83AF2|nr:ATP-binding protein [Sporomusa sp.]HWR43554.1 ATP-binding protein [Sporomusa sp.]